MDQSPILKEQSVEPNPNQVRGENTNSAFSKKSRNMYVLNLDGSRIFWILSIVLLLMTFVLLLGYWIGSDATSTATDPNSSQISRSSSAARGNSTAPAASAQAQSANTQTTITEEPIARSTTPENRSIVETPQASATEQNSNAANARSTTTTTTPAAESNSRSNDTNASTSNSNDNTEAVNNSSENEPDNSEASTSSNDNTRNRIAQRVRRLRTTRGIDTTGSDRFMTNSKPFSIQIATHFSLRMAMSIKKQLRNKNHAAYIFMHKSTNGKKFYKIRVGAFASRDGAKKYLAVLQKTGLGKRSIIVHR